MSKRNSNIEVLRILSMFMIILSHYTIHNSVTISDLPIGFNRFLLETGRLGDIGVIIFILLTGYFSIEQRDSFKLKKLVCLIGQVLFYSFSIYLIFCFLEKESFSLIGLVKNLLPITFKKYWFMTAYIMLYIFIPFINIFLNSLSRKKHLYFIMISLFIFSILHMLTTKDYYGNELIQFIYIYSIGAYLKKYKESKLNEAKFGRISLTCSIILLLLSVIIFDLLGVKTHVFALKSSYLFSRTSIISVIFAVSLVSIFGNKKEFSNSYINKISSCTLGVYLIHDNEYVREILWKNILKVSDFVKSPVLILHMLFSVILIFGLCVIIEYIRKKTIDVILSKIYDKIKKLIVTRKKFKKILMLLL